MQCGVVSDIALPVIYHGDKLTDRKSVFQAHLAAVTHRQQVSFQFRLFSVVVPGRIVV